MSIQEKKAELLAQLTQCYGIVTLACRRSKVGRTTFYEYQKNDPEFAFKVHEIQEGFIDYVETKLFDLIRVGDRGAMMFYLKCKGKNRGYR